MRSTGAGNVTVLELFHCLVQVGGTPSGTCHNMLVLSCAEGL